ncbi:hypothetical protein [Nocardioides coralli]|uniref:hypothetical protein n=1 Tax=Nocardioides coralli TaxID=2872154 RepID=UPI001CA442C1|nr:hypothetical protein [Nocardioides coralli]QZY28419.1 hypothetical protein K6T13_13210 [Nocardioides coralli]
MRRRGVGAALLAGVVGLTGCTAAEEPPAKTSTPAPEPTTLASYDARGVTVVRGPFCDRVSPTALEHALGEMPEGHRSWENGDRLRLPDGTRDRVQEYGCSWTGPDGTRAAAWVFAPPVTPKRARTLVREATGPECSTTGGGDFGDPSVATTCTDAGVTQWAHRGLFGDAWLSCTLEPGSDTSDETSDETSGEAGGESSVEERASAWCVAVLEAARA